MSGLPSFVSDDSFSQTTIIGYILSQGQFTVHVIVYLFGQYWIQLWSNARSTFQSKDRIFHKCSNLLFLYILINSLNKSSFNYQYLVNNYLLKCFFFFLFSSLMQVYLVLVITVIVIYKTSSSFGVLENRFVGPPLS